MQIILPPANSEKFTGGTGFGFLEPYSDNNPFYIHFNTFKRTFIVNFIFRLTRYGQIVDIVSGSLRI